MINSEVLAIVIPQGTSGPDERERCLKAAKGLTLHKPFQLVEIIDIRSDEGPAQQRNTGIDQAVALGAGWMLYVEPDEVLNRNALAFALPALEAYDGLWGGIDLLDEDGQSVIAKKSLFCASDSPRNFHMALQFWVGKSHFVRTVSASKVRFDAAAGDAWYADYLVRMWETARCLKTAQPVTARQGELSEIAQPDRDYLVARLNAYPQYMSFGYRSHQIHLPYTGRNPALERVQLRGLFYEQSDLETLARYVPPNAVFVDVGANTGNHTVFFAKVLAAAKVIPVEPNPQAAAVLKRVIDKNGLASVDTSKLGIGIGRKAGHCKLVTGRRGHLGTVRLEPVLAGETGDIPVEPLDTLIDCPVDVLKIDVEGMEIDVLEGARRLLSEMHPLLLVEAQDENITALLAILDELGYRIECVFPDQGYANYLALPQGNG